MKLYTKILLGMAIGVIFGLLIGPNSQLLPKDGAKLTPAAKVVMEPGSMEMVPLSQGLKMASVIDQKTDGDLTWLKLEWTMTAPQLVKLKTMDVKAATETKPGTAIQGWTVQKSPDVQLYSTIGATVVSYTEWIGRLFLALIKMVVVPLVFFSLVVGIASLGDVRALGRMGGKTLGFFSLTTVIALVIGVGMTNLIQPGRLISADDKAMLLSSYEGAAGKTVSNAADAPGLADQLLSMVPSNPIAALAGGDMLQVIVFAALLGVALTFMKEERSQLVVDVFDRLNEAMVMLVQIAMKLAPVGVAALLFKVVGSTGPSILLALGVYALVVMLGLGLHIVVTYGSAVRFGARLPFIQFLGAIKEAMLVAFSTSSSSATLPVTKQACEDNLSVSPQVTSFVLPLGATVNMDGTALYQGVAAIFIAQIYGLDLSIGDQATIVFSATLASVGAAGVPGAGMITLAMVLTAVGVPTEGLALVLGVDRILDMFRTATNVIGDSTAAALMGRLEGNDLRIMTDAEDAANPNKGFEGRLDGGPHPIPLHREAES